MATNSAASVLDVAARLRLTMTRTARRLRQEAGTGPSPALTSALATVSRQGPLTPSELAAAERFQRPTATRILAKLEAEGLVERAEDPADRRSSLVSASPAGEVLLIRLRSRKDAFLARRLAELDPADLKTLDDATTVLERLLDEETPR